MAGNKIQYLSTERPADLSSFCTKTCKRSPGPRLRQQNSGCQKTDIWESAHLMRRRSRPCGRLALIVPCTCINIDMDRFVITTSTWQLAGRKRVNLWTNRLEGVMPPDVLIANSFAQIFTNILWFIAGQQRLEHHPSLGYRSHPRISTRIIHLYSYENREHGEILGRLDYWWPQELPSIKKLASV